MIALNVHKVSKASVFRQTMETSNGREFHTTTLSFIDNNGVVITAVLFSDEYLTIVDDNERYASLE